MDNLGTPIIALISEAALFQGENNVYLYKVGTQSSVLINQVSLFQICPLREDPLHTEIETFFCAGTVSVQCMKRSGYQVCD